MGDQVRWACSTLFRTELVSQCPAGSAPHQGAPACGSLRPWPPGARPHPLHPEEAQAASFRKRGRLSGPRDPRLPHAREKARPRTPRRRRREPSSTCMPSSVFCVKRKARHNHRKMLERREETGFSARLHCLLCLLPPKHDQCDPHSKHAPSQETPAGGPEGRRTQDTSSSAGDEAGHLQPGGDPNVQGGGSGRGGISGRSMAIWGSVAIPSGDRFPLPFITLTPPDIH